MQLGVLLNDINEEMIQVQCKGNEKVLNFLVDKCIFNLV